MFPVEKTKKSVNIFQV